MPEAVATLTPERAVAVGKALRTYASDDATIPVHRGVCLALAGQFERASVQADPTIVLEEYHVFVLRAAARFCEAHKVL